MSTSEVGAIPVIGRHGLKSVLLRDALMNQLRARGAKPGDRVPSETEIVHRFKVGRSTAREAVKLLEHDGLVEMRPGLGRFLTSLAAATVDRPITRFEATSKMLESLGRTPQTLVLSVIEGPPDDDERVALGLSGAEAPVVRVTRLRSEEDEPLVFSEDTLVREHIPGPIRHVDWTASITSLCRDQGRELSFSTARIQAVNLPEEIAQRYSLDSPDPWLLITETVYSTAGEPVLYAKDYHRGDLFAFNVLRR
jgi:GntR family transcriptional regulator